jgi:hypothetical protein
MILVLDKDFSHRIEWVRRQYSSNAHDLIRGIGGVSCLYVNPETEDFRRIDYRLYDPEGDGKSKLDHVHDMLTNVVHHQRPPFRAVLRDSGYVAKDLMRLIEPLRKIYYCRSRRIAKWMIPAAHGLIGASMRWTGSPRKSWKAK